MKSPCSAFSCDQNGSLRTFGKSAADSGLLLLAFDTGDTQASHFLLPFSAEPAFPGSPSTHLSLSLVGSLEPPAASASPSISFCFNQGIISLSSGLSIVSGSLRSCSHPSFTCLIAQRKVVLRWWAGRLLCQQHIAACGTFLSSGQDLDISSFLPLFLQGTRATWDELLSSAAVAHSCSG